MVDTVIFDVDGVLWAAQDAYNDCTLFVARRLAKENNWPDAGLSLAHIHAFKRFGGFNSDWDMIWALVVLLQARFKGRIPPERSWDDLIAENGDQGITWAQGYAGPDAPDFNELQRYYDAHYWGADRYPAIYDSQPVISFRPGFAHAERPFPKDDFFSRLRSAGIQQIGIITGRNRNEMRTTLAGLNFEGLLIPEAVLTDEDGHKPDPDLLQRALTPLHPSAAVMVGDTIADLQLVLNYRRLAASGQKTPVQAVIIAQAEMAEEWLNRGADAVLPDVNHLPDWLHKQLSSHN